MVWVVKLLIVVIIDGYICIYLSIWHIYSYVHLYIYGYLYILFIKRRMSGYDNNNIYLNSSNTSICWASCWLCTSSTATMTAFISILIMNRLGLWTTRYIYIPRWLDDQVHAPVERPPLGRGDGSHIPQRRPRQEGPRGVQGLHLSSSL